MKTLRTDNGGEFTSKIFEAHLKACGIRHELTTPKTPEQNGAGGLIALLRNRSPTSAVEGKSPHEAWYGRKPRVEHLRVKLDEREPGLENQEMYNGSVRKGY